MYVNPYYAPYWKQDELEHYGILGMKWGVRRYQNADGTLTEAGKKRAQKMVRKNSRQAVKYQNEADRLRKKIDKVSPSEKTVTALLAYDNQRKSDQHKAEAFRLINEIYPGLKDIPSADIEKYIDYLKK